MSENIGLYLHIPFCVSKCAYCDFYSLSGCDEKKRYIDSLILQTEDYSLPAEGKKVDTIFIGGGTPTTVPVKNMLDLLSAIPRSFDIDENAEFTIEANPATVTTSMLKKYYKNGVNRISFGLQSADNGELASLSRIHTYEQFVESYNSARDAGFENINIDLMFGIPNQTPQSLRNTLQTVCDLGPEHISLYGLRIEDGTPFAKIKSSLRLPDEDTEYGMYEDAISYLKMRGYDQYEISNFAKPGYECRHNLHYWHCDEYLGMGPGAHSYFNNMRYSFKKDINLFMDTLEKAEPDTEAVLTDELYSISPSERVGEYIMLALRLTSGIDTVEFKTKFGLDFEATYDKHLKLYTDNNFMTHIGTRYAFTNKGKYVSNYILSAMLDFKSEIISSISKGSES